MKCFSVLAFVFGLAASVTATATKAKPPTYKGPLTLTPIGTNWITFNLDAFRQSNSSQGSTYNVGILSYASSSLSRFWGHWRLIGTISTPLSGNWTNSAGQLVASVVPGAYNGEVDLVDKYERVHFPVLSIH